MKSRNSWKHSENEGNNLQYLTIYIKSVPGHRKPSLSEITPLETSARMVCSKMNSCWPHQIEPDTILRNEQPLVCKRVNIDRNFPVTPFPGYYSFKSRACPEGKFGLSQAIKCIFTTGRFWLFETVIKLRKFHGVTINLFCLIAHFGVVVGCQCPQCRSWYLAWRKFWLCSVEPWVVLWQVQ